MDSFQRVLVGLVLGPCGRVDEAGREVHDGEALGRELERVFGHRGERGRLGHPVRHGGVYETGRADVAGVACLGCDDYDLFRRAGAKEGEESILWMTPRVLILNWTKEYS